MSEHQSGLPPSGMEVELCGLKLKHPVLNCSGTFDLPAAVEAFGQSVIESFPFSCFVSKTITVDPRTGNPPPRIVEAPYGLINSIGLPNRGIEGFIASDLPRLAELPVPLVVSVAGFSDDEFVQLVRETSEQTDVDALELNISCPNVKSGCVYGVDPGETERLLTALRDITEKPLIVKLTPQASDIAATGAAAERGGADALSLINTVPAPIAANSQKAGEEGSGGLSGPAIKHTALARVREVSNAVRIPLVGMGGIGSGSDAYEFLKLGCRCVAVGTENFRDPLAAGRIAKELQEIPAPDQVSFDR